MSDEKDLKEEGEDGEKGSGVLSDSVLDAFDEAVPVEDDLLAKDPFETEEEGDDEVPLDSGDFGLDDF